MKRSLPPRPRRLRRRGQPSKPNSAPKLLLQDPEGDRAGANLDKLRGEWRLLYRGEPPRISRDLLLRAIAYRRQELKHGGLSKTTRRKLKTLAKMFRRTGQVGPDPGLALKPGARLVREWHGRTHTITVTENGFEYAGRSYASLTKIAKKITGAHWSGPRFFGLVRAGRSPESGNGNA